MMARGLKVEQYSESAPQMDQFQRIGKFLQVQDAGGYYLDLQAFSPF